VKKLSHSVTLLAGLSGRKEEDDDAVAGRSPSRR